MTAEQAARNMQRFAVEWHTANVQTLAAICNATPAHIEAVLTEIEARPPEKLNAGQRMVRGAGKAARNLGAELRRGFEALGP